MKTKTFLTLIAFLLAFAGLERAKAQDSSVVIWSKDVPEHCYAVKISPEGETLANSAGQYVQIRNIVDGELVRQFGEHDNEKINSITYLPDGLFVFTGAGDYQSINRTPYVKMWDIQTGKLVRKFETDDSTYYSFIRSLDVSIDGTQLAAVFDTYLKGVSNIRDITLFIWDIVSGDILKKVKFPSDDRPSCVKYSPTGEYLIIDNYEDVVLYSYPQIEFVSRLDNYFNWHETIIRAMDITSDGKTVASIDDHEIVKIWDVAKRNIIKSFETTRLGTVNTMIFDNNDKFLIMGGIPYKAIEIWNYQTGELIYKYHYPEGNSNNFDIDNSNNILNAQGNQLIYFKGIYEPIGVEKQEPIIEDILYPNPTSNIVNIEFTLQNEENIFVELLDLNGQTIEVIANDNNAPGLNTIQYNCTGLANGIYWIKISSASFAKMYKLVKEG